MADQRIKVRFLTKIFLALIIVALFISFPVLSFPMETIPNKGISTQLELSSVRVGDINGDDLADIVVTSKNNTIQIYIQSSGDGIPDNPNYELECGNGSGALSFSDINGDSRTDIIVANIEDLNLEIFYQKTDRTYNSTSDIILDVDDIPVFFSVVDLNNDTHMDLVVGCLTESKIKIFFQSASGTFGPSANVTLPANSYPISMAAGDLNSDGLNDIAVSTLIPGNLLVFFQDSPGVFPQVPDVNLTKEGGGFVEIGDVNNDTKADLILINQEDSTLELFYQKQTPSYQNPDITVSLEVNASYSMLSIGDFNDDNFTDIACAKLEILGFDEMQVLSVEIFYQKEDNAFYNNKSLSLLHPERADLSGDENQIFENLSKLPKEPPAIGTGDLNNDGLDDIVCAYNSTGEILIYYQELDSDHDGYPDEWDMFPFDPGEWVDTDYDGIGNNEDTDDDNDGYNDTIEVGEGTDPLDHLSTPLDFDGDYIPDSIDPDDDNDGFNDVIEIVVGTDPKDPSSFPVDTDSDGIPDDIDDDDDNDGRPDSEDAYPLDANRWKKESSSGNYYLYLGLGVLVIIFVLVIILLKRRGMGSRKKEEEDEEEEF